MINELKAGEKVVLISSKKDPLATHVEIKEGVHNNRRYIRRKKSWIASK